MTNSVNAKVLLITPNPAEAALIGKVLAEVKGVPFELQRVRTLPEGLERLSQSGIDVVLLNLSLIRGESIPAFATLSAAVPRVPVVALGGPDDEGMARQVVQHGADDYLLTDYINTHTLSQALRNAIKRREIEDALFVERDRAQVTLNSIGDAVLSTDIWGNITYLNPVAEKMTGWARAEAAYRSVPNHRRRHARGCSKSHGARHQGKQSGRTFRRLCAYSARWHGTCD